MTIIDNNNRWEIRGKSTIKGGTDKIPYKN